MLRLTLLLVVLASPVLAHELWVEPAPFQPAIGAPVKARLVNGQGFEGLELSYLPKTFVRFAVIAAGVETPVTGRIGDRPALAVDRLADGLAVAVYQSTPSTVAYADFAKFESFGAHKDLGDVRAAHVARSPPDRHRKPIPALANAAPELVTNLHAALRSHRSRRIRQALHSPRRLAMLSHSGLPHSIAPFSPMPPVHVARALSSALGRS